MYYESNNFEVDYYKGWLVITDKIENKNECVQLTNQQGRNITKNQFKSSLKTSGDLDKTCKVFMKLAAKQI